VLDAFSFSMAKGELITLLGPSGCGKTTLLRLIAGLLRSDSGSIRVEGRELTRLRPTDAMSVSSSSTFNVLVERLAFGRNLRFALAFGVCGCLALAGVNRVLTN
jgi:putative spermidine/putrescine transport system ATP-binding protein